MKKAYIAPSMKENKFGFTDFVCEVYKGSLDGIVPETGDHTPGSGNYGGNNPDPDEQATKYRGNFYEGF